MKPYVQQLLAGTTDFTIGLPIVREYMQARILECLQQTGAFLCLAFHGGTSLRFLYDIPRYSEDLDFALESQSDQYDFTAYLRAIEKRFSAENYTIDIRIPKQQTVVNKAFIRFRGLPFELGLTPHKDQTLAIKLEVDTNPPPGAITSTTLINRHIDLHLRHHGHATLLSGKLHAILNRPYTKGRDWYDLWWYLGQPNWPLPNFDHLNNSLAQTGSTLPLITNDNWKQILHDRAQALVWDVVINDVEPFIIFEAGKPTFSRTTLLSHLK